MRRSNPIVLGAGPAGAAAATILAQGGARPLILERDLATGDAICGGFVSWRTLATLERLGLPLDALGGHRVTQLRLFAGGRMASAALPKPAIGISRLRLDTLVLGQAVRAGAAIERGVSIRALSGDSVRTADGATFEADSLFLATGKYDLRGVLRPRSDNLTLGLRIALDPSPAMAALVGDAIELHLFDGGYCGVMINEMGVGNLCMAVRKSRLTQIGGDPATLIAALGRENPALGERIAFAASGEIDAISAVPYGWIARETLPGQFKLGDQAAVIPSLAGEGNGIALASGIASAEAWLSGGPAAAPAYQARFANAARRPVSTAMRLWHWGERPVWGQMATRIVALAPSIAAHFAGLTRIRA
jgi:menaquinone-9 beta-reductase